MKKVVVAIIVYLFLSGCSTNPSKKHIESIESDEGVVVGSIKIQTYKEDAFLPIPLNSSNWKIEIVQLKKEPSLMERKFPKIFTLNNVKSNNEAITFHKKLKEGVYYISSVTKRGLPPSVVFYPRAIFKVTAGKASYVGDLSFTIPEKVNMLKLIFFPQISATASIFDNFSKAEFNWEQEKSSTQVEELEKLLMRIL